MSELLNTNKDGDKTKHPQREELIKKWEKTGILDNIDGILEKKDLVKLMEGKASQLLREEKQKVNMDNNYVLINEDGITIGELKDFLKNFNDDLILSDTIVKEGTTYSTRVTELFLDKEGVGLISQMTRDELNKK